VLDSDLSGKEKGKKNREEKEGELTPPQAFRQPGQGKKKRKRGRVPHFIVAGKERREDFFAPQKRKRKRLLPSGRCQKKKKEICPSIVAGRKEEESWRRSGKEKHLPAYLQRSTCARSKGGGKKKNRLILRGQRKSKKKTLLPAQTRVDRLSGRKKKKKPGKGKKKRGGRVFTSRPAKEKKEKSNAFRSIISKGLREPRREEVSSTGEREKSHQRGVGEKEKYLSPKTLAEEMAGEKKYVCRNGILRRSTGKKRRGESLPNLRGLRTGKKEGRSRALRLQRKRETRL